MSSFSIPRVVMSDELRLLELAVQIGGLADSNGHFTHRVALAVADAGGLDVLTVSELAALIERQREIYDSVHRQEVA